MEHPENNYIITGGEEGKKRLKILAEVLEQSTRSLLEINGPIVGKKLLDLGCGGGDVSIMAAKMVGENGSVTAIYFDKEIIELDIQDAIERGIHNISFQSASAYDISFDKEFDMVYSRFLLSHLSDPLDVLKKMIKSLKTGGSLMVEDVQFSGHFCYPRSKAFDSYLHYYSSLAISKDQNPEIGPSLFELCHQAGLEDIKFDTIQPGFNKGPGKWMAYITMEKIKDAVIKQGLAAYDTIDNLLKELEKFTKDERTIISLPRIFRVWGIKK